MSKRTKSQKKPGCCGKNNNKNMEAGKDMGMSYSSGSNNSQTKTCS